MSGTTTLLSAVSANGTGTPFNTTGLQDELTLEVSVSGTVTAFSVQLQGSVDGVTYGNVGEAVLSPTAGVNVSTGVQYQYFQAVLAGYQGTGTVTCVLAYNLRAGAGGGGGGGGGTVTSVAATDASIVVSGTATVTPTIATGTLDVIATQHPPAANWSNNSHKITSVANGSSAQDAAAFGQITAANASALALAGGTMTGVIAMGSHKITGLTNGSSAQDVAAFGQIPLIDSTAADILPPGVQSAGVSAKAAAADHVHQNSADLSIFVAPSGATGEAFPRMLTSATQALSSGLLMVTAIPLPSGLLIGSIAFCIDATAATGLSHGWYVLLDSSRVVRAVTADQTSGTWGSTNTLVSLSVSGSAYTTTYSGLYYAGIMVVASGMPSVSRAAAESAGISAAAPALYGTSSSGQTTAPATGTTMGSISVATGRIYACTF